MASINLRNGLKSTWNQLNVCKVLYQGRKKKCTVTKQVHLVKQQQSRKGSTGTTDWTTVGRLDKNIQISVWSMEVHSAQYSEPQRGITSMRHHTLKIMHQVRKTSEKKDKQIKYSEKISYQTIQICGAHLHHWKATSSTITDKTLTCNPGTKKVWKL